MFLAGLNLPGANLNSQRLVRRMKYMDVFHNPVTKDARCLPPQARRIYSGQQCAFAGMTRKWDSSGFELLQIVHVVL